MIKTFKVGEYSVGGIIKISTRPRGVFQVKIIDSQTKALVHWRFVHGLDELKDYLEEISTPFWADKMVTEFKKKLDVSKND